MTENTIINKNGHLSSCNGPRAVEAFRLKALITMIDFKLKTGFDMDSRMPALKIARRETGLKTRNLQVLRAAVVAMMNAAIDDCTVVDE